MEEVKFKLRGKVIQMARKMKGIRSKNFAGLVGVHPITLCAIENEKRSISKLNEIRILRGLRQIGVSDVQIKSIQSIIEHDEGTFDE
ncbi:hypothetical protein ACLHWY_27180 [Priestia aryabhattai]|uniref:hypothetical protein n=1 Tax=Priestia aryabhattai TaxID=412384 RepID=UPI00398301D1